MTESALNAVWVPVKLRLEGGRDSLAEREWATLISLLTIWVEAEKIKLERGQSHPHRYPPLPPEPKHPLRPEHA